MPTQPSSRPITLAILAMGGEGGGVLADWIVSLAEGNGYLAQSTSVPGVAQRTGATIYYVELFSQAEAERVGRDPVLALMPVPGDVDIVLASELMEAGRAVQRGLVTPERTTLIASTHRVYSIAEKSALGNGIIDSAVLIQAGKDAARHFLSFDMAKVAQDTGSVVSAVLFGALAGSGALPFARERFERTIAQAGVGVKASLEAFAAGLAHVTDGAARLEGATGVADAVASAPQSADVRALLARLRTAFPAQLHATLVHGVRRLIDYQDTAYAAWYLDRIAALLAHQGSSDTEAHRLADTAARYLALWMS